TLVYWRKRIAQSQRPHRVFDKVAEVIAATGILRGRRKRCVDSTVFDDAVATQDTVTQLVAAMRRVARGVARAAPAIPQVCAPWTTVSLVSPISTGTTRPPSSGWCLIWSTTPWRCWLS